MSNVILHPNSLTPARVVCEVCENDEFYIVGHEHPFSDDWIGPFRALCGNCDHPIPGTYHWDQPEEEE